ncbi:MAG TPA: thioredoxin family protein [Polyangiaceae bacterium]
MKLAPLALLIALAACHKEAPDAAVATSTPTTAASTPTAAAAAAPPIAADAKAAVGQPAPDFTLADLNGKPVSLHDYKGKVVVLEWFNPECPFVNNAHDKGSLKGTAARHEAQGVAWLAVNSSGAGKQGSSVEKNVERKAKWGLDHPILLDPSGAVGHAYGATNTPNMFVIDDHGVLAYRGAIDNSPDGEGESPTGGKLVNYVDEALSAVAAKRDVAVKETKAYGCGVKYQ